MLFNKNKLSLKIDSSVFLLLVLLSSLFSETSTYQYDNSFPHLRLRYLSDGFIEVTNSLTALKTIYDLRDEEIPKKNGIDPVVIRLSEIDTSEFTANFRLIATVPLAGFYYSLLVTDSDMDGKKEIVGQYRETNWQVSTIETRFYEYRTEGAFDLVAKVDVGRPYDGKDVDSDGLPNILFHYSQLLRFCESPDSFSFATRKVWEHRMWELSAKNSYVTVGDLDKDGNKDILYLGDQGDPALGNYSLGSYILEHVSGDTCYNLAYSTDYPPLPDGRPNWFLGGYAVGDFDRDAFMEFVTGNIEGNIYLVENWSDDSYQLSWQGEVPTKNAYYHFAGDDLDGDGRPEFFIGGDHSSGGETHSLITAFEAAGNNVYQPTWAVDIIGGSILFPKTIAKGDVDGDGVDEFSVLVGPTVVTFQAESDDTYKLIWAKPVYWADAVTMGDVNGDGRAEIIISVTPINEVGLWTQSYIYEYAKAASVGQKEESVPLNFQLFQNYPNPFNSATVIKYQIPTNNVHVRLTLYNIRGEEVIRIADEVKSRGTYELQWRGTDNNGKEVGNGMYFCQLKTEAFAQIRKMLLVR